MAAKTDQWVRIFDVSENKRHPKGYTIYRVKSTVFPRSQPQASTSVTVWRRYSEIRSLHKSISSLQQKIGLLNKPPPFPRASILNRFEAEVVETRRLAALELFKYIGQCNALFTSEVFTKFFENENSGDLKIFHKKQKVSKQRCLESESLASTLGLPEEESLYSQLSDDNDDLSVCSSLDSPPVPDLTDGKQESTTHNAEVINGQDLVQGTRSDSINDDLLIYGTSYIATGKNGEVQNLSETQNGDRISGFNNNIFSGQENDSDVFVNTDNIHTISLSGHNESIGTSQFCTTKQNRTTSTSSISSVSSQTFAVYENPVHHSPKHSYGFQYPIDNSTPKSLKGNSQTHLLSQNELENTSELERTLSTVSNNDTIFNVTPLTPFTNSVIPTTHPDQRLSNPQEIAHSQYIFLAAQQISAAQQCEELQDYREALNYYREGVGTLLQGVQDDCDETRREAVRRKTAQYLQRAEQLMSRITRKEKRQQENEGPAPAMNSSGEAELKCSSLEVSRYCTLGTAGSVLLATDTTTGETVAIKVLLKNDIGGAEKTTLPQNIPFMVPIIRYHETDTAILLVLKFIGGGKLWDHIKPYVSDIHWEISSTAGEGLNYVGRRLIEEEEDQEPVTRNHNTEQETLYSHSLAELQLSSKPAQLSPVQDKSKHLQVKSSTLNQDELSVSSRGPSLSLASEGCLQLFSHYTTSLPSSSSMLLPSPNNKSNIMNDIMSKSVSVNANLTIDKTDKEPDIEATSVGSDTLSGVSEDFSCSLPGNTEETNGTTDQYFTATNGAQELLTESKYSHPQVQMSFTTENDKEVSDHIPSLLVNKECLGLSKNSSFDEKQDVTEVSFSSTTLPSFSYTDKDDTEFADIDIDELIRNSKELLQNVDHTLKQSKTQSIYSTDSDESTSGEHSELPLDSVTCGFEKKENSSIDKISSSISMVTSDTLPSHLNCDPSSHIERNCDTQSKTNILATDRKVLTCNTIQTEVSNSQFGNTSLTFIQNIPELNTQTSDRSNHISDEKHNISGKDQSLVESSLAVLLENYSNRSQNTQPHLPETLVKVWVSQIVSAIGALHNLGIIWQDFNPNNVLLDEGGSILVTYESRWSTIDCRGKGLGTCHGNNRSRSVDEIKDGCLAPELSSPLMCATAATDWWSVGALMYNLLTGKTVSSAHPSGITSHTEVVLPEYLSAEAASLLNQLLAVHPTERLGGGALGVIEIKDHPFFAGVHWQ